MSRWRVRGVLVVVLVLAAAGCGGDEEDTTPATSTSAPAEASAAWGDGATQASVDRIDVTVNGTARTALVHLPGVAARGEPLPVVLSFHGASSSAEVQQAIDGLTDKSDEEGFVVVHPEGLVVDVGDQVTNITGWDVPGREVDEPAFVAALLDELAAQVCIDPSRVYATGFSLGGELALALPCALPERIVAVAPVAGAYQSTVCESGRATPVMAFHGLDDLAAPIEGRRTEPFQLPVLDVLAAHATRNGCTGGPETEEVTPTVQSLTWAGCEEPTVLYQLQDHGHAWPGHPLPFTMAQVEANFDTQPPNPVVVTAGLTPETMAENVLLTNVAIDATDLMWDFFAQSR